jgi:hypothetical protein
MFNWDFLRDLIGLLRYDYQIVTGAGQAILLGGSPYDQFGYISPYPIGLYFVPFAFLPERIGFLLYTALVVALLWKKMGWRCIWPLLSVPVLFNLVVGQVDLPMALAVSLLAVGVCICAGQAPGGAGGFALVSVSPEAAGLVEGGSAVRAGVRIELCAGAGLGGALAVSLANGRELLGA